MTTDIIKQSSGRRAYCRNGSYTMTARIRPPMASHSLDLPAICDVCGKGRSTRRHTKCSQIRQQREGDKWAAYMANLAAKRALGKRAIARGGNIE